MENVLVIACGASKIKTDVPVAAIDLYSGRQFRLAKELAAKGWTILILSAGYGLIEGSAKILPYNRKIDADYRKRAVTKIRDLSLSAWIFRNWTQEAKRVFFYGGREYLEVFEALCEVCGTDRLDSGTAVTHIIGAGCGEHYSVLKEIVAEA